MLAMVVKRKWLFASAGVVLLIIGFVLFAANQNDKEHSGPKNGGPRQSMPIEPTKSYSKTIARPKPITLTGSQILEIKDTHYTLTADIELHDKAKLIITDSFFDHYGDHAQQNQLDTYDQAQVIVKNSVIRANQVTYWNFHDTSLLEQDNVQRNPNGLPNVWYYVTNNATVKARSTAFTGTLDYNARGDIRDSENVFVELVYKEGARVDEVLREHYGPEVFTFPNNDEQNIGITLTLQNVKTYGWGITVSPNNNVVIRDATQGIIVTFSVAEPWKNVTAKFDDLQSKLYKDQTWTVADSSLRLINTKVNAWSPIVASDNTLIITNSTLADIAFSSGTGTVILENITAELLRAQAQVQMTVRDSHIKGDVVAQEEGKITLINTAVDGKIAEEGKGQVIIE